ncbi:MAG: lipid-A-disaccharide synthase [Rhodospirillaceae bacterium]
MDESMSRPLVWLIAGEPSGDLIGARLMSALRDRMGEDVRIAGVGGEAMQAEGLASLFPISDIALMGVVEIVHRIPLVRRRQRETVERIRQDRPDIVVSIDVPEFSHGVWKGLRGSGIPLVHYVAPTVWAWRPKRTKKFAKALDHLLALLPFEPPFFHADGLACTFVGHPVLEGGADGGDGEAFRERHGIASGTRTVCVLPGSRRGEIDRLTPIFREAAERITQRHPEAVFVFPTVAYVADFLAERLAGWPGRTIVIADRREKFDAMAACDVAIAASGTVSLELALARVPHVIAYRMNGITVAIVRRLHGVRQKFANLVNILLEREVVPELIQENCTGERVAAEALRLLDDGNSRGAQLRDARSALDMLRPPGGSPSRAAADVVMSYIGTGTNTERE